MAPVQSFCIDSHELLERVSGDRELLKEIVDLFFENTPQLLVELHAAIARGDRTALEHTAHTLKGSVGNFSAPTAYDKAERLETAGRHGDFDAARTALAQFEYDLSQLIPALQALIQPEAA